MITDNVQRGDTHIRSLPHMSHLHRLTHTEVLKMVAADSRNSSEHKCGVCFKDQFHSFLFVFSHSFLHALNLTGRLSLVGHVYIKRTELAKHTTAINRWCPVHNRFALADCQHVLILHNLLLS